MPKFSLTLLPLTAILAFILLSHYSALPLANFWVCIWFYLFKFICLISKFSIALHYLLQLLHIFFHLFLFWFQLPTNQSEGVVNQIGETHIGLLVNGTFNASISRKMAGQYECDIDAKSWIAKSPSSSSVDEDEESETTPSLPIQVGATVKFKIVR